MLPSDEHHVIQLVILAGHGILSTWHLKIPQNVKYRCDKMTIGGHHGPTDATEKFHCGQTAPI